MGLDDLKPAEGSRKAKNRLGRGTASGQGGTLRRGEPNGRFVQTASTITGQIQCYMSITNALQGFRDARE